MKKQKKTVAEQVNEMTREQQDGVLKAFKLDLIMLIVYLVISAPFMLTFFGSVGMFYSALFISNYEMMDAVYPFMLISGVIWAVPSAVYGIIAYVFLNKKYNYSLKKYRYIKKMRKAEAEQQK